MERIDNLIEINALLSYELNENEDIFSSRMQATLWKRLVEYLSPLAEPQKYVVIIIARGRFSQRFRVRPSSEGFRGVPLDARAPAMSPGRCFLR